MMKTLLVCSLLLAAAAGPAPAAGLNLGWGDCSPCGAANRNFACNTNTGTNVLIGSFVAPAGLKGVTGWAAIIDLQTASPTLPDWWKVGSCRLASSVTHTADFTAGPSCCSDYFGGAASGAGVYILPPNSGGANRVRIEEGWGIIPEHANDGSIYEDDEVYAFKVTINNSRSTGLGACAGCLTGACIVFNEIGITQYNPGPSYKTFTNPATRAYVTWQGGGGLPCPDATPARRATWGMIKGLYR